MVDQLPSGITFEPTFLIEAAYGPDAEERRRPVRAQHLARAAELQDQGVIIEAGSFPDMSGSLFILRAASEEAALAIMSQDVYMSAGVWVEVRVRPFMWLTRAGA